MQQRKQDASQHLEHKFDDYPLEFVTATSDVAANLTTNGVVALNTLSEKQIALYRHIQNAKINNILVKGGFNTAEQGGDASLLGMRTSE